MRYPEYYFHWTWQLQANPDELWPLATDTNRFDRDAGTPTTQILPGKRTNARQRVRLSVYGVPFEYVQEPFEWIYPQRFGVIRHYSRGPLADMRVLAEFTPRSGGGTQVDYQVWARASGPLGVVAIPAQIGVIYSRQFAASFRRFDDMIRQDKPLYTTTQSARFAPGGRKRLLVAQQALLDQGADPDLVARLVAYLEQADDLTLARIRPYALADYWGVQRRDLLTLCLLATRAGMLSFRWDLLCPLCRGPQDSSPTLGGIKKEVHCDTCNIDFAANFERSVELTFRPNAGIRPVEDTLYCVGGPHMTPHIVAQTLIQPGEARIVAPVLETGRYRARTLTLRGGMILSVMTEGLSTVTICAEGEWPDDEPVITDHPAITFENRTDSEQLFILERVAWTDQAATAADVIMLQTFRDLFSSEALRPGEQISVGSLTVLFTDLRGSTQLYRQIGDAPAFGLVLDHFEVLRRVVNQQDGVIVKTIGDAVMAVFRAPADALRAAVLAQRELPQPLQLKVGIHYGPCIAVTLNDRLDYFGSTVNIAARLESLSLGDDIIISSAVHDDPEVAEWLQGFNVTSLKAALKGFDDEHFELWRIRG
jgi:class 3 adenylate cyclase